MRVSSSLLVKRKRDTRREKERERKIANPTCPLCRDEEREGDDEKEESWLELVHAFPSPPLLPAFLHSFSSLLPRVKESTGPV